MVAIHAQLVGLSAKQLGSLVQRFTLGLKACQLRGATPPGQEAADR
jgi:hypothetical protein